MEQVQTTQGMPELEIGEKESGAIRYLEHGSPHWRIRWHCHDEYELHLIVASSGKMFIGDYIGKFRPGCLVLTGPRVPHNWVSFGIDGTRYALRDHIVHFEHEAIASAATALPELRMLLPLLERSRHGIEFLNHGEIAEKYLLQIRESDGAARLGYFCELLDSLARSPDQRQLSTIQFDLPEAEDLQGKIDLVIEYVMEHYRSKISMAQVADIVGMSENHFSRFFRKTTGNRFREFVNRVRVAKACDLLAQTGMTITYICHEVGFNNVANFNRRFAQYKQISPSKYRQLVSQRYTHQKR